MKSHGLRLAFVLAALLSMLAGCAQETATPPVSETAFVSPLSATVSPSVSESLPSPTAAPVLSPRDHTPEPDLGIVQGLLSLNGQPATERVLYLAPIITNQEGMEIAALDPVSDPRAQTDASGYFVFLDVPPGRYALGLNSPIGAVLIRIDGHEIMAEVEVGQITDLGTVPIIPFDQ